MRGAHVSNILSCILCDEEAVSTTNLVAYSARPTSSSRMILAGIRCINGILCLHRHEEWFR